MFHRCPAPPVPAFFTLRVARARTGFIESGGVIGGGGGLRLARAPQEGRHELHGMDVRHEGFGVDVELMAEGRAEGLMLHLGGARRQRQEGSVPARGQTRCFHVHLVPAVGSRVAAAAAHPSSSALGGGVEAAGSRHCICNCGGSSRYGGTSSFLITPLFGLVFVWIGF